MLKLTCLGIGLFLLLLPEPSLASADFLTLCRLFKDGTLIRYPGSCDLYIKCNDGEGTYHRCENPLVFNGNTGKCETATTANSVHCSNRCEGLDGVWKAYPTDCRHYYYCSNGEALFGGCGEGLHFDEASQSCVYEEQSSCVEFPNICEALPKTNFRDETDCSKYYECSLSGNPKSKACGKTVPYFQWTSGACALKKNVPCTAHPKSGICGTAKKPLTGYQADGGSCRGYFNCANLGIVEDLDPVWYQCPEGTFFDSTRKTCAEPTSVVCTHNRCEGRGTMLVTSSVDDCHSYYRCENGTEVAKVMCERDMFFDERIQACTFTFIEDKCCDGTKYE
ncbi:peritrophin-48 [Scaptodrosophila lebanonensis]|uniref:Peritrophin-48 n=1 Tax=Drosophila lebanonensis TaxID=7225 RepID=A0A6J2T507_DROLE|nr:peritrophin-48 [Scaptodrosophila lebanonensis]